MIIKNYINNNKTIFHLNDIKFKIYNKIFLYYFYFILFIFLFIKQILIK